MRSSVKHLNPKGLHKNPAYSQAVVAKGNVKSVYVGGSMRYTHLAMWSEWTTLRFKWSKSSRI